jgi:hypothetical protein
MNIVALRPTGGSKTLAWFDVELSPGLRAHGFELRRTADGRLKVISPRGNGKHAVTFTADVGTEITNAARIALSGGLQPYANT